MKLIRNDIRQIDDWYNSNLRNTPLVLFGAGQVGKSTLAEDFAKKTNRKIVKINFWKDENNNFHNIFNSTSLATRIIEKLEIYLNTEINPENSILILDEIQSCPKAYSSLKSFKEDLKLPVIATGSYLKLMIKNSKKDFEIPIGCTTELKITPLSFDEFLQNRNLKLYEYINKVTNIKDITTIDSDLHNKFLEHYSEYLFVGGMPEAVKTFIFEKNKILAIKNVRNIQKSLIKGYTNDFLKFKELKYISNSISTKLHYTFQTIAKELNRDIHKDSPVSKFKFKSLGKNAEYRNLANLFEYLYNSGLIIRTFQISKPDEIFSYNNETKNAFKCFYFDVGILNAFLNISFYDLINNKLNISKGAIAENFVAQELYKYQNQELLMWKDKNNQIEFLSYINNKLIPIEVKASRKSQKSASFNKYIKNYKPEKAIKISLRNFGVSNNFISLPIYLINKIFLNDRHNF